MYAAISLFGITLGIFALTHAVRGDPVTYLVGQLGSHRLTPQLIRALKHEHHLDEPLPIQYVFWLQSLAHLDLGRSISDNRPVLEKIAERLPNTLELNLAALLLALAIGIPLALASAWRPDSAFDRTAAATTVVLFSIPNFWIAILLIDVMAVRMQLLPLYGMSADDADLLSPAAFLLDHIRHLILPVTTLALGEIALFARFGRAALIEVLRKEFITAARARGVGNVSILLKHGLRNALAPLITLLGISIPLLLSGSVVVERIFQWNGVGRLFLEASLARDYPTVMGLTLMTSVATLLSFLMTDLLYAVADPRVELEGTP
jgi:peptide/nickel transport system permease protein